MADGIAPRPADPDTRPLPPADLAPPTPEHSCSVARSIISFPPRATRAPVPTAPCRPAPRPEPFRFLQNNLMEIDFSGKVFIKQGTIYSYSGNLTFWVKDKRPGGHAGRW